MAMGPGSGRGQLQSDINVTPLVDVCLVLLIIFMVVTPMLQKGIPVNLPLTNDPEKKPENQDQRLITVQWKEPPVYYLDKDQFPKEELQRQLDELYQRKPSAELVIKADQRLKYGAVKEAMRMTKEAGFQDAGLIVERKQQTQAAH